MFSFFLIIAVTLDYLSEMKIMKRYHNEKLFVNYTHVQWIKNTE